MTEDFEKQIAEQQEKAAHWQSMYEEQQIERDIRIAAQSQDAFRPEQFFTLFRDSARVVDGNVVVEFDGERISADEAIRRMRSQPETYGNLFRLNVAPHIAKKSPPKEIDVSRLSMDEYMRIRQENPELLGLRRRS